MTLSLIPFRLSVLRVCQGSCNGVLRKFHGRFREVTWMFLSQRAKGVSRRFLGCFNEVSRTFQDSLKGVSQKLPRCFKKISRMCQERSVKGVSRKFQGCYKEVLRVFQQTLNVISIFQKHLKFENVLSVLWVGWGRGGGGVGVNQTRKKSLACMHCLRTIFAKIVDIFV